jgi:hypothetical protein
MNDKPYAKDAVILTVTSLIFSLSPIIVPILAAPFEKYISQHIYFATFIAILAYSNWLPAIAIAVFAYKRTLRMIDSTLRVWIRTISLLIIIGSVCFGIYAIFGLFALLLIFDGSHVIST